MAHEEQVLRDAISMGVQFDEIAGRCDI